jgi:cytidylate kinase
MGPSAVGKEEIAVDYLAPALRMIVVNTGKVARGAALMADRLGQFEEGRGGALRLRDGAESRIRDWALPNGRRGFHFVVSPPDRSAHIFFGDADLTDALHPAAEGFRQQKIMEPAAALLAANPTIHRGFLDLWRRTAIELGGAVMVTKRIDEYLPQAHAKYYLSVTDPQVSAGYRIARGVSATGSFEDELEYLKRRDQLHADNGLDVVPPDALRIDMTELLNKPSGMRKAADIVLTDLVEKGRAR